MDKSTSIINFLMTCPQIKEYPLYFNFAEENDNNKQLIISTSDRSLNRPFIDGSVQKRYTFTIIDYRSVTYKSLVTAEGYPNENVEEYFSVQSLIDWINEQADLHNYPDFGDFCMVDDMRVTTNNPNLNSVDTSKTPALAKYSISIQIDYIDYSKQIWK